MIYKIKIRNLITLEEKKKRVVMEMVLRLLLGLFEAQWMESY